MMKINNKAFTLVEMIAVVALISILSGTAIMSVSNIVNKSKKKTYQNFEKNLKVAATNYIGKHPELVATSSQKLSATKLIDEGYLETMVDPANKSSNCNKNSYVTVYQKRANGAFNIEMSYKICLVCSSYKTSNDCGK